MPHFGPPGERIAYTVYPGPVDAPPLFLIHGFTASKASFLSNVDDLRRDFTVVTVELLGHGESDAPEESAPYAPGPAVERITGLIDYLGHDTVLLCGHSLGGALALRVALDAPEHLAGVIVINSNSAAGDPAWRERAHENLASMAARARAEGTDFLRGTRLYPAASRRLREADREALAAAFDSMSAAGFAGTAEELSAQVNAWERLPELSVPMLLIIGDRDADFVRNAPAFIERLPGHLAQWITFEGAGHAANLERPALFYEAVREFATQTGYINGGATLAPPRDGRRGTVLTVLGALLIGIGIALFAAAFFVGGGSNDQFPVLAEPGDEATPTATVVEGVAGSRTRGPGPAITPDLPTAMPEANVAESPTPAPPAAPPPADTPVPQPTQEPAVVATAVPTETPTPEPPTETPAPAGPYAAISGRTTAGINETIGLLDASSAGADHLEWQGCTSVQILASCAFVQPTEGCYEVRLNAYFFDEDLMLTATHYIAVGNATCGN